MSILDAATDAARVGFRAIVAESHHHGMQPDILALESAGLRDVPVKVYGGIALNRTVGGLNPYAVELALGLDGKVVWSPTISSPAHIEFHRHNHHSGFPVSGVPLRDNEPISILDESGGLVDAARDVVDVIRKESVGRRPAERPMKKIADYYRAAGPERTIFSSDLGQRGNPLPVTAYRRMVRAMLEKDLPACRTRGLCRIRIPAVDGVVLAAAIFDEHDIAVTVALVGTTSSLPEEASAAETTLLRTAYLITEEMNGLRTRRRALTDPSTTFLDA